MRERGREREGRKDGGRKGREEGGRKGGRRERERREERKEGRREVIEAQNSKHMMLLHTSISSNCSNIIIFKKDDLVCVLNYSRRI